MTYIPSIVVVSPTRVSWVAWILNGQVPGTRLRLSLRVNTLWDKSLKLKWILKISFPPKILSLQACLSPKDFISPGMPPLHSSRDLTPWRRNYFHDAQLFHVNLFTIVAYQTQNVLGFRELQYNCNVTRSVAWWGFCKIFAWREVSWLTLSPLTKINVGSSTEVI